MFRNKRHFQPVPGVLELEAEATLLRQHQDPAAAGVTAQEAATEPAAAILPAAPAVAAVVAVFPAIRLCRLGEDGYRCRSCSSTIMFCRSTVAS
jgi:hypothetical protein